MESPKQSDSSHNLLRKIIGPLYRAQDTFNNMLVKLAGALASYGATDNELWRSIARAIHGSVNSNLAGSGSPVGVVTPGFFGQVYSDLSVYPPIDWESGGLTSADWTAHCQEFDTNMGVILTSVAVETFTLGGYSYGAGTNGAGITVASAPTLKHISLPNAAFLGLVSIASTPNFDSFTAPLLVAAAGLTISGGKLSGAFTLPLYTGLTTGTLLISSNTALTSISLPAFIGNGNPLNQNMQSNTLLTSYSAPNQLHAGRFLLASNPALTSVNLSSLVDHIGTTAFSFASNNLLTLSLPSFVQATATGSTLTLTGNANLASVSLPVCVTLAGGITANGDTSLTTVSFPNYLPTNAKAQNFGGCALNQASVDHVLARCVANAAYVSGTVTLNGGTNSAPSAAGLTDAATLTGRGVSVLVNP